MSYGKKIARPATWRIVDGEEVCLPAKQSDRRKRLRAAAADADYGIGSANLAEILASAQAEAEYGYTFCRFKCRITGEKYLEGEGATIDWMHLSSLVHQAAEDSGFDNLPWNLGNMVNANVAPGSYPRFASRAGAEEVVKKVQRFCGWLKAAADLPALRRVVKKTQSPHGMWSMRTVVHLWDFAERHPSPGKVERKLWKVRERAEAILSAFEGQKPSWASIAQALLVTQQVGKAAVMAVAGTLSGDSFSMYRDARQWLVDYHLCKVEDTSDGVEALREAEPRLTKAGIDVFRIAIPVMSRSGHQVGADFLFLVRSANGRTFHSRWGGANEAMHEAIRAWKRQDELALANADLVTFLEGSATGYCPLVIRSDSYSAGNCESGTESWLRERGWGDRKWIPAVWLVPHLDYGLVRNVAMNLYRRHSEQRDAA